MKKLLTNSFGILVTVMVTTQCQQPRQSADSSTDTGARLFVHYCSRCHLSNGSGGPAPGNGLNAVDIRQFSKTAPQLQAIISYGYGQMPAFKDSISDGDISAIANYVSTQIELNKPNANNPDGVK